MYAVNGYPGSGKTELGKIVGQLLEEKGIGFLHASSIDPVKAILMPFETWDDSLIKSGIGVSTLQIFKREVVGNKDWDGVTKDAFWRKAMSDLKQKIVSWNPHVIDGLVIDKFRLFLKDPYVAFVDIRESEYINSFCKHAKEKIIDVETGSILVKSDSSLRFENASDSKVEEGKYDIIIHNRRDLYLNDEVSLWALKMTARTFIDREILPKEQHHERIY